MECRVRQIPLRPGLDVQERSDRIARDLSDARRFEPERGVYAVFATWNGRRVACLTRHLARLEGSAERVGFRIDIDRDHLRTSIAGLMDDAGLAEARVRIVIAPRLPYSTVSVEPYLGPPEELRRTGVVCGTAPNSARSNPRTKQAEWITRRQTLQTTHDLEAEPYEILLLDSESRILEGTRTNFYAIAEGPVLRTAAEGVLHGIARGIVLEVARSGVIGVDSVPVRLNELSLMDEAFISSASRGIVPVVQIDDVSIGSGRPGPHTKRLIEAFTRRAVELEEPLVGPTNASPA